MVLCLVEKGASLDVKDKNGQTVRWMETSEQIWIRSQSIRTNFKEEYYQFLASRTIQRSPYCDNYTYPNRFEDRRHWSWSKSKSRNEQWQSRGWWQMWCQLKMKKIFGNLMKIIRLPSDWWRIKAMTLKKSTPSTGSQHLIPIHTRFHLGFHEVGSTEQDSFCQLQVVLQLLKLLQDKRQILAWFRHIKILWIRMLIRNGNWLIDTHKAAMNWNFRELRYLIENGADFNTKNNIRRTRSLDCDVLVNGAVFRTERRYFT